MLRCFTPGAGVFTQRKGGWESHIGGMVDFPVPVIETGPLSRPVTSLLQSSTDSQFTQSG